MQRVSRRYRGGWRKCAKSSEQHKVEAAACRPLWTRLSRKAAQSQVSLSFTGIITVVDLKHLYGRRSLNLKLKPIRMDGASVYFLVS